MRTKEPYRPGVGGGEGVTVVADIDSGLVVLAVDGAWGPALRRAASTAVRKCLAEHPAGLVLDLTGLGDRQAVSVPTWLTARRAAGRLDPPVPVAVALPAANLLAAGLDRVSVGRILPRYGTVAAAKAALAGRQPLTGRLALRLDPGVPAPALARDLVTDACRAWGLSALLHPGRLVVSELATNAVVHARTPLTVVATLRRTGLHVAVSDHDRRLPRLLPPDAPDDIGGIGHGLRIVAATATAWGALPTTDGKMVWAVLRPRHQLR